MTRGQVIVTCLLTVVATLLTVTMLGVGPDDDKKQVPSTQPPTEVLIIGTPMDYDTDADVAIGVEVGNTVKVEAFPFTADDNPRWITVPDRDQINATFHIVDIKGPWMQVEVRVGRSIAGRVWVYQSDFSVVTERFSFDRALHTVSGWETDLD